nr:response regulator [Fundidesulfovibrio terrae]
MIVENDIVTGCQLAEILRSRGHEAVMVEELYCLEEIKARGSVDMVITDIFLNDVSGLQIVLDVKEFDPGIKVVAMSGGGPALVFDYLDYAREFGADAVVRKPLDEAGIAKLLEQFPCVDARDVSLVPRTPVGHS